MSNNSIKKKKQASGGLHVMMAEDDVVHLEYNGEKLKIVFQGIASNGEIALSFIGSKSFLIGREKLLDKLGIEHD